ncbi:MAG: PorT family protein [Prevotella sp.]|jgi:hypothetical protein|nr:PorT family protein [Prevotella sp.]
MKKILLLAVVLFASLNASAQQDEGTWSITPKVGFNLANIVGDHTDGYSMKFALFGGAEAMYQVTPMIGLSGGLLFSAQGCELEGDASIALTNLNIPLMANFYVAENLALKIGLQPDFNLSGKYKYNGGSSDISSTQTVVLDIPFGISYDISDFVIDARYNLGVSKIFKGEGGSQRNSVFQISVGYKFQL